jgi:polyribonucleotide nucleotidyltransferase
MDIKIDGLPYEQLEKALMQAKEGRLHILNEMSKTINTPAEDLKPHAPRMIELIIDKSFIGAVIGPGGKVIQELQANTGTVINIEEKDDKGYVSISSSNAAGIKEAVATINSIAFVPTVGDVYSATVESVMPYGVFVKFSGKSGLVHVSELSHTRINDVTKVMKEGDVFDVKYIGDDPRSGKMRLSKKALEAKPEKKD